jgi:choline kinase
MGKLTDELPKCLMELRGQPLIDLQVKALQAAGLEDIAVVTGYRRELLTGRGTVQFHNPRWESTNMVTSLACADERLATNTCIVSYSDIFYHQEAVSSLIQVDADVAITYDPNWQALWAKRFDDPLQDAESFRLNRDGTVALIGGRVDDAGRIEGQYMGLLRFSPRGWAEVQRVRSELASRALDRLDMTSMLQRVVEAGRLPVVAIPYEGEWGEVDDQQDLELYNSSKFVDPPDASESMSDR